MNDSNALETRMERRADRAAVADAAEASDADEHTAAETATNLIDLFDAARGLASGSLEPAIPGLSYREFLDAVGVAVYTTDADGRITFFNRAAEQLWGRAPEIGEEWCGSLRLLFPDGRPMRHDECPMAIALKEQRSTHGGEAIAERPDGRRVAFVAYPTPLLDRAGTMIGAVNVLVDVTERRRTEEALQAAASALRASNAVKDEFLGLISHELRTPVTTIFGNAQILRERGDDLARDDQRSMIVDIAEDSERLLAVIENLLLMTRLGSGSRPDLEPQVLNHVVTRAVDAFGRRHPDRPVAFIGVPEQLIVDADATHLDLVLQNFLSNADKYSPADSPIDIVLDAGSGEARVRVLDRGIGVTADESKQVFAPFFRTDEAKRRANGIGVGLAVCQRIVDGHGGRIWAGPRPGGGSEFGFALPLDDGTDPG
jgi:PAS domain S-box-containing protein